MIFDRNRASELMEASGVDLLLVSSKRNAAYVSGFLKPGSYSFEADMYGFPDLIFVAIPQDQNKDPFIVLNTDNQLELYGELDSWITDRKFYGYKDYITDSFLENDPIGLVKKGLEERSLDSSIIALELKENSFAPDMLPVYVFDKLRKMLPNSKFVDGSRIIQKLRIIKNEEEIKALRKVAQSSGEAVSLTLDLIDEGVSEKEVELKLMQNALSQSILIECVHLMFLPSKIRHTNGQIIIHPTSNTFQRGDMVYMDIVSRSKLYMADMSRYKFRIKPESKVSPIYETLYDANEKIRKSIRPGLKCSDIASMAQSTFDAAGLKPFIKDVFGHGIGVSLHEPPYISLHDQTVLELGMVLTVELGTFVPQPGFIHLEDTIVVNSGGCYTITNKPGREMMLL